MKIEFIQPLTIAWNRMIQDLFKPFRAGRWFAVGFAAWLVSLGGGGGGGNLNIPSGRGRDFSGQQARVIEQAKEFLSEPLGVSIIVGLAMGVLLLVLLFLWLSSRAHFVFLDQVTGHHWRIKDPWGRYATQGNSLFLWKVGFTIALFAILAVLVGPAVFYLIATEAESFGPLKGLVVAWMLCAILAIVVPAAYTGCFLHAFVVPLMYREGRGTNDAWRRFLPLLRENVGKFLVYGLFVFALAVGVAALMIALSCATCCLAFCLLVIPYLGTVFSLPIPYTFRGLGPSFLAQFGADWWTWPEGETAAPPIGEVPSAFQP